MAVSRMPVLWFLLGAVLTLGVAVSPAEGSRSRRHYDFFIRRANYTRLCHRKSIPTVNGRFPGPTIYARKGDVVTVDVHNQGDKNVTIHWHGVDQPRNPWSDGPEFITQCPMCECGFSKGAGPGSKLPARAGTGGLRSPSAASSPAPASRTGSSSPGKEGTLWWHAHSDFDRATVHGSIVIRPRRGTSYPFKKPHKEIPIILGEWWKGNVRQLLADALQTGGEFQPSDANTINGQPGDMFPCSRDGTFTLPVEHGKTYILRPINAALVNEFFFGVAGHRLTMVGTDASYVKPTATAVLEYTDDAAPSPSWATSDFPILPAIDDTAAADAYTARLRSLASDAHPARVPRRVDEHMLVAIAVNEIACAPDKNCQGPRGNRLAASLNNVSFEAPRHTDILGVYYHHRSGGGVRGADFPSNPPLPFNFTADDLPPELRLTARGTRVKVLGYGTVVEVVLQDTAILSAESHPIHLHGHSFYVVGTGSGNFDDGRDPAGYNLVDPPYQKTVAVPKGGWSAIRFRAENPGVWFMHCHFERRMVWGMDTVFIVKDGSGAEKKMMPPPPGMPRC
ncbi:hypothetical protein C2845_PM11G25310 [Panicum miliaceum]|uniref:laccase n=1 Tax=Panicum miliaceum TaxID=4540 RepID=A0A3L6RRP8_PANMI|nr:hypothetical protein C2845_PM11G25310 [Panicum miliaceum]